jgi:hypothetical protein
MQGRIALLNHGQETNRLGVVFVKLWECARVIVSL